MQTSIVKNNLNLLKTMSNNDFGKVQNIGFMWVINYNTYQIVQVSDNVSNYLPVDINEIVGLNIHTFSFYAYLQTQIDKTGNRSIATALSETILLPEFKINQAFYVSFYFDKSYLILEFEPFTESDKEVLTGYLDFINQFTIEISQTLQLQQLLTLAINRLQAFGNFNHLMITRYEGENEFEIVAENFQNSNFSMLGYRFTMSLHSDFITKILPNNTIYYSEDIAQTPSLLIGLAEHTDIIDLSPARLRLPTKQYSNYMKQFNCRSSIILSIVVKGKLWGIIEIFNIEPKPLPLKMRQVLQSLAYLISSKLETKLDKIEDDALNFYLDQEKHLIQQLIANDKPEIAFLQSKINLLRLNQATGVVLRYDGKTSTLGNTPPLELIDQIFDYIQKNISENKKLFKTHYLSHLLPEAGKYASIASGIMFLEISRPAQEFIMWFKPETERKLLWVTEPTQSQDSTIVLLPLANKIWLEVQKYRSATWSLAETKVAKILRNDFWEYIQLKNAGLVENNQKLNDLLLATQALNVDLSESQMYLKAIFDSSPNIYMLISPKKKIITFNRFAERAILIMTRQSIRVGDSTLGLLDNGIFRDFALHFEQAVNGRKVLVNTKVEARKDFWFEVQYLPVFDDSQQIIGVSFVATDITDKREAILQVIAEKEKVKKYLDIAQIMISISDNLGVIQLVNQKICETLGYQESELVGKDGFEFIANLQRRAEIVEVFRGQMQVQLDQKPFIFEAEEWITTKDNRQLLVAFTTTSLVSPKGELLGFISSAQDITEKRLAEARLAQSEANLKTVFDMAPLMIFSVDKEYKLLIANELFLNYMNSKLENPIKIGDNLLVVLPAAYQPRAIELVKRCLAGENFKIIEKNTFGGDEYLERTFTPIKVDNEITSILVISRNITQEKQYEEEILIAKTQAETMNRLKTNFLANMSHEIRTPINGIIGLSQVMKEETSIEDINFYLDLQIQSGRRLLDTLNNILQLSRIESETPKPNLQIINIHHLIKEILPPMRNLANNKDIQLNFIPYSKTLLCVTDSTLLMQVLNNVVGNAIKFTENGFVTIETNLYQSTADFVQIKIIDTGIGITQEFLPRVFNVFEQESSGIQRTYEGAGLGLSIAKKYLDILGGQIEVSSQKGKGSTFTIILPYD
jgi:PAS domain S-box-containing protein